MGLSLKSIYPDARDDLRAAFLEFVGTIMFLLLGLGGIQASAFSNAASVAAAGTPALEVASINQLLYIAVSMGLSLLVSVWAFYRVTGGAFNPAVSTALLLVGGIKWTRFVLYCIAQLAGAIVASALLSGLLPGSLAVGTAPAQGVSLVQAVWIEAFLTAALVLSVLMLAAEKHKSTAFAPIGIGLTLFACHLWGVPYTGAGMNTARSFGPAVIGGFHSTHWVYWVGPFIGSLIATGLYTFLKHIKYAKLNPDQDTDDHMLSPPPPLKRMISRMSESQVYPKDKADKVSNMV
ncbi:hypothetical protein BOTBODRAFT_173408 [Botryobasidium botryosum FD-172 SS1]|uniref:Aquaporin n=1 Tax=Botryobasidium botryosum (strain FD-172 SS1) TaxID=930990 RepID=A0A067MW60_BOTB1|nr:hypothetical protein BOTBODRAFT_173408 [Botryobasidium botryosum FD-172 SS1]